MAENCKTKVTDKIDIIPDSIFLAYYNTKKSITNLTGTQNHIKNRKINTLLNSFWPNFIYTRRNVSAISNLF
jgi:hypothetical protein